jgi:CrcB-like protein
MILVALGGAVGSALRYALSWLWPATQNGGLPLGTLAANVLGCLVIGFVGTLLQRSFGGGEWFRLLVCVGFCGGLTTLSSLVNETSGMAHTNQTLMAAGYLGASVALGFVALHCGTWLASRV